MVCLFDPGDYDRNRYEGSARFFPTDGSRIPIDMNLLPLYSRFSSCLMHVACEAYGKLNPKLDPCFASREGGILIGQTCLLPSVTIPQSKESTNSTKKPCAQYGANSLKLRAASVSFLSYTSYLTLQENE